MKAADGRAGCAVGVLRPRPARLARGAAERPRGSPDRSAVGPRCARAFARLARCSLLLPLLAAASFAPAALADEAAAAAATRTLVDPVVTLRWAHGEARAEVRPGPGEHVNDAAPASLDDGRSEVRGAGALGWARLPYAADAVWTAIVPLCTDDGRACRTVQVAGRTPPAAARRGAVALTVAGAAQAASPGPVAVAGSSAAIRVYDFQGVWCPPCNQMRAEVLEDPADAGALAGVDLVAVDVDRPESWPLKSRYDVTGYPTLVAVAPDGAELDRLVGYPGNDLTLAWFAGLGTAAPLAALEAGPPTPGVDDAARVALRLAKAQREDAARRWLSVATGDSVDLRWARLLLDTAPADADWMLAHAPDGEWIYDVIAAWPERWPQVAPRLPALDAGTAAAALQAWAEHAAKDPAAADAALAARVGAAALIAARMDADPGDGKGHVTELAQALAELGQRDRARKLLVDFAARYPDEFTYDFVAAQILLDAKDFPAAEAHARTALARAWGDQRLRAVQRLARALAGQGRAAEAIAALEAELAAAPRPAPDQKVRTTRYLADVEKLLAELRGR